MLFRHKVLTLLSGEGLLSEERIELLDSWKHGHTGFSAHNAVTLALAAGDQEGLERLGRYLLRPPLSLERMELDKDQVHYRHKRAPFPASETFDAQDFLARLLMHIPAPRLDLLSYMGEYSSVVRARRREAAKVQDSCFDALISRSPWSFDYVATAVCCHRMETRKMRERGFEPSHSYGYYHPWLGLRGLHHAL